MRHDALPAPIGPLPTPLRIGPFHVGLDGQLIPAGTHAPVRFSVRWRGRRIQAELGPSRRLRLSVLAARVPYSAEDAARRAGVLSAFLALRAAAAPALSAMLTAAHELRLEQTTDLEATTASRLVTAVTLFVLLIDPYLDLVEERGATLLA